MGGGVISVQKLRGFATTKTFRGETEQRFVLLWLLFLIPAFIFLSTEPSLQWNTGRPYMAMENCMSNLSILFCHPLRDFFI